MIPVSQSMNSPSFHVIIHFLRIGFSIYPHNYVRDSPARGSTLRQSADLQVCGEAWSCQELEGKPYPLNTLVVGGDNSNHNSSNIDNYSRDDSNNST